MSTRMLRALLATALSAVPVSCVGDGSSRMSPVTIPLQPASYYDAVWLENDVIVLNEFVPVDAPGSPEVGILVTTSPVGGSTNPIDVGSTTRTCEIGDDQSPTKLPDGRLGFIRFCHAPLFYQIVAVNLASSAVEVLADLGDPIVGDRHEGVWRVTYRAGMRDPVVQLGVSICEGIASVSSDAVSAYAAHIQIGSTTASLADYFDQPCKDTVNARGPEWSPDGQQLALFVAVAARGLEGQMRIDVPYDLVLHNPSAGITRVLASGLSDPSDPRWSPDGRFLLFRTATSILGEFATWLVDGSAAVPPTRLPLPSAAQVAGWSPDGTKVVVLLHDSPPTRPEDTTRPATVDVTPYLSSGN